MTGGGAVVNEKASVFRFQELSDIWRADFEFERRGNAVERFHALALHLLAVLMQIDESGSDHQPSGVDDTPSLQRVGRDADNHSVADPDVAHSIESGLGIHNTSAFEHEIERLRGHNEG